jgi:uncharacterized membrane protein required for colicin V production
MHAVSVLVQRSAPWAATQVSLSSSCSLCCQICILGIAALLHGCVQSLIASLYWLVAVKNAVQRAPTSHAVTLTYDADTAEEIAAVVRTFIKACAGGVLL